MPNATVNKCWSPPLPQMVGGGPSQGQGPQMGNNIPTNGAGPKPMGRPIVKGGGMEGNMGAGGASNEFLVQQFHQHMIMQQQQQHRQAMENQKMQQLLHQLQQQQQQQQRMMASGGGGGVGASVGGGGGPSGPNNPGVGPVGAQMRGGMPFSGQSNPGQANSQLRAIVGSGGGGAGNGGGGGGVGGPGVNSLANMSELQRKGVVDGDLISSFLFAVFANPMPQQQSQNQGLNFMGRDGGLSPTSNQLARWFSPELLAKAQAGKLPSLNQSQAMSLEEFERNMSNGPVGGGGGGVSTQPPIGIKRN